MIANWFHCISNYVTDNVVLEETIHNRNERFWSQFCGNRNPPWDPIQPLDDGRAIECPLLHLWRQHVRHIQLSAARMNVEEEVQLRVLSRGTRGGGHG
jgi:hypothetical protein